MNSLIQTPIAFSAEHSQASFNRPLSAEMFQAARACWKAAAARKALTSDSLAAWAIIRGNEPKQGFCAITNPAKLANGALPWAAYDEALRSCSSLTRSALAPWESMLTEHGSTFKGYQWEGSHPLLQALMAYKAS